MSERYELSIGGTPPSLNRVGSRGSHWAFTKAKKDWQSNCFIALLVAKVPKGLTSVQATACLVFGKNRRRDEGNYRALLEKSLGDALVLGGFLTDDTPEQFRFGAVYFQKGKATTRITLEVER